MPQETQNKQQVMDVKDFVMIGREHTDQLVNLLKSAGNSIQSFIVKLSEKEKEIEVLKKEIEDLKK